MHYLLSDVDVLPNVSPLIFDSFPVRAVEGRYYLHPLYDYLLSFEQSFARVTWCQLSHFHSLFIFTVKTVRCSSKLKRTNMWALLHAPFSKVKNKLPRSNIYPHLHNQNKIHIFIWPLHGNTLHSLLQDPVRLPDLICVALQSADPKGLTEATVILTTILCWLAADTRLHMHCGLTFSQLWSHIHTDQIYKPKGFPYITFY